VEFGLLGPLEVRQEGARISLGGPRQRILLAALLFQANSVATKEHLAEVLWDVLPAAPESNLRTYVAQLRRKLHEIGEPGDRLVTTASGYSLTVRPAELDLRVFRDLIERGRRARHERDLLAEVKHLGEALRLWRGQPLAGETLGAALRAKVAGLEETRLSVAEQYASARIELGQAEPVIEDLRSLIVQYPLREELWAQLMLALYRSNRRSDALEAFARARRKLVADLGVEPGPRLQLIQREILSGDASPILASRPAEPEGVGAWRQLPMDIAEFTGRTAELRTLHTLLDSGLPEAANCVVISAIEGMAGVGKTKLAIRFARQLLEQGRYHEIQLWTDLRGFDAEHQPADPAVVLENFLRLLGVAGHEIPHGLEERAALYRARLAGRQALVLLDNAAHEGQIRPLLPGAPGSLVLVTSRRRLHTLDDARVLPLQVLASEEAVALLARISGGPRVAAEPRAAARVAELCGHLPIALSLAARRLQARRSWTVADLVSWLDAGGGDGMARLVPRRLEPHVVFERSYRAIPADQQELFRLLSLHPGDDFTAESAAALSGIAPECAELLIEALLDEHLVQQASADRYRFHDLVRPYARHLAEIHDAAADRTRAVHRLFAWYLHAAEAARALVDPQRIQIFDFHPLPPESVVPQFVDYRQALVWFEAERANLVAVVRAAAARGLPVVAWQLPWVLLSFFYRRSYRQDWITAYRAGLDAARELGARRAEGIIWRGLGVAHSDLREFAKAIECHGQAQTILEEVGDVHGQAWNLNNLGVVNVALHRFHEGAECFERALPIFSETRDRQGEGICLNNLGDTSRQLGDSESADAYLTRALAIQRELDDAAGMQFTLSTLGSVHRETGRHNQALRHYEDALAMSQSLDDQRTVARTLANLARTNDALNRFAVATTQWARALEIFDELGDAEADDIRQEIDDSRMADQPVGERPAGRSQ
jgi:DNA-binding SARP family transcriptional activator